MSIKKIVLHGMAILSFFVVVSWNFDFIPFYFSDFTLVFYLVLSPMIWFTLLGNFSFYQLFRTVKNIYMKNPDPELLQERREILGFLRRGWIYITVLLILMTLCIYIWELFNQFDRGLVVMSIVETVSTLSVYLFVEMLIFLPWRYYGGIMK